MITAPQDMMALAVRALGIEASAAKAQTHLAEGSHCITPAGKRGARSAALEQLRAARAAADALIVDLESRP